MALDIVVSITGEWQSFHRRLPFDTLTAMLEPDERLLILNRPTEPFSLLRRRGKLRQFFQPLQILSPQLWILTPRLWLHDQLAYRWSWTEQFNLGCLQDQLMPLLRPEARKVLWLMHPSFFSLTRLRNWDYLIYDCYDEFVELQPPPHRLISVFEERLVQAADYVITASGVVAEAKAKRYSVTTHLVPNPTSYSLFSPVRRAQVSPASELASIPAPRVGYIGGIKPSLDQDLIYWLAQNLPQVSFVLLGSLASGCELGRLLGQKNIYWLGHKNVSQLPAYLAGMHTGLIPYKLDDYVRSINPNKALEYLMAGLEVVSAPIPALLGKYPEHIHLADSAQAFLDCLQDTLSRAPRQLPDQVLYENSWEYWLQPLLQKMRSADSHKSVLSESSKRGI